MQAGGEADNAKRTGARALVLLAALVAAFALAVPLASAPGQAVADAGSGLVRAQAVEPRDLNALMAPTASDDVNGVYTITDGGTYALSGDLASDDALAINAPGEDVVLKLEGHVLSLVGFGAAEERALVRVQAAKSVTVEGSGDPADSVIRTRGGRDDADLWGIASTTDCSLTVRGVTIRQRVASNQLKYLNVHGVYATAGSVLLDNCTIDLDLGNQARIGINMASAQPTSGLCFGPGVTEATVSDCTVSCTGSPAVSLDDPDDLEAMGNAYGVYSLAATTLIEGGSFSATSALGSATALYGSALTLAAGPITLKANADKVASGVLSTSAGSVEVGARLDFGYDELYSEPAHAVVLRSSVEEGFVLGPVDPGDNPYSALVASGGSVAAANADGTKVARFGDGLSAAQRGAWVTALVDEQGACEVEEDAGTGTARFALDAAHAKAKVTGSAPVRYYATAAQALAELADGETLTLMDDASDLDISASGTLTIDLGGHKVRSIAYSFDGDDDGSGLTVRHGAVVGSRQMPQGECAVYHESSAPLTLDDVAIELLARNSAGIGVLMPATTSGDLRLSGSTVDVSVPSAASSAVYGLYQESQTKAAVTVEGSTIRACTSAAGVSAVAISSYTSIVLRCSNVLASTADSVAGALLVGGTAEVSECDLTASTSEASDAYGIWGRTVSPRATRVEVRSSAISALCDSAVDTGYWTLRGATVVSTTYSPTWEFSGTCSFKSAAGQHVGMNAGTITVGPDFGLDDNSDSVLAVYQQRTAGDAAVATADGSAVRAELAACFEPASRSYYDGWDLGVDPSDASKLAWGAVLAGRPNKVSVMRGSSVIASYPSVAAALSGASEGDTVYLNADVTETGSVAVNLDDLTVDLGGHVWTLRAGSAASATTFNTGGAIAYRGAGTLRITGGAVRLKVGIPTETIASANQAHQGIAVSGGGTLKVDSSAQVDVEYEGGTATSEQRNMRVRGVTVTDGSVELTGSLLVHAEPADGAFGVMTLHGLYTKAAAGAKATVDVKAGASVQVDNGTARVRSDGNVYAGGSTGSSQSYTVHEVSLGEGDELYAVIQDQFWEKASYDDPNGASSSRSNPYGSGIYYAAPMLLEEPGAWYDGLRVWAFSDPVEPADVGRRSAVKPTHVYVQVPYDSMPTAYAVATDAAAAGVTRVTVDGSVRVACPRGQAYGVDLQGTSNVDWAFGSGARVHAAAAPDVSVEAGSALDLRSVIAFGTSMASAPAFSGSASLWPADTKFVAPQARGIRFGVGVSSDASATAFAASGRVTAAGSDARALDGAGAAADAATFAVEEAVLRQVQAGESVNLADLREGAVRPADGQYLFDLAGWTTRANGWLSTPELSPDATLSARAGDAYYATYAPRPTDDVKVVFANVHDEAGALVPARTLSFAAEYGQTVAEVVGASGLPQPADYRDEDAHVTYRFTGWRNYRASESSTPIVWSPQGLVDPESGMVVDASQVGVTRGALTLWATYVAVRDDVEHLVRFFVDTRELACVVPDGIRPSYQMANAKSVTSNAPSKVEGSVGSTWLFDSWAVVAADGADVPESDRATYSLALPIARADAAYRASFEPLASKVQLAYYTYKPTDGGDGYEYRATTVTCDYEPGCLQAKADEVAELGATVPHGDGFRELVGWSTRSTDKDPLYDADHPMPDEGLSSSMQQTYSATYYGVYAERERQVKVTFHDGSEVLGPSVTVAGSTTVNTAFAATGAAQPADKSADTVFLGWNDDPASAKALGGDVAYVSALADQDDAADLYAIYGPPPVYHVYLYGTDRSTALYDVSVVRGKSVAEVAAQQGAVIGAPAVAGKFFRGWRLPSGAAYDLTTPVMGTSSIYADYVDTVVQTDDPSNVSAQFTCTSVAALRASGVTLDVSKASSADVPVRNFARSNGYTVLRSYNVRAYATSATGARTDLQGAIGTIAAKLYVGAQYAGSSVRVFWLGGSSEVLSSAVKTPDSKGYVTVSIGDLGAGDFDEGGNLAIAYVEGASSSPSATKGQSGGSSALSGAKSSSGSKSGSSGATGTTTGSGRPLNTSSLKVSALQTASAAGLLGRAGAAAGEATGATAKAKAAAQAKVKAGAKSDKKKEKEAAARESAAQAADAEPAAGDAAGAGEADGAGGADAAGGVDASSGGGDAASDFNSDVVVFGLIVAAAALACARGLWWLLVGRRRGDGVDQTDGLAGGGLSTESVRF